MTSATRHFRMERSMRSRVSSLTLSKLDNKTANCQPCVSLAALQSLPRFVSKATACMKEATLVWGSYFQVVDSHGYKKDLNQLSFTFVALLPRCSKACAAEMKIRLDLSYGVCPKHDNQSFVTRAV